MLGLHSEDGGNPVPAGPKINQTLCISSGFSAAKYIYKWMSFSIAMVMQNDKSLYVMVLQSIGWRQ